MLEEREDFDKILLDTLKKTSFLKYEENLKDDKYYINKYLNFISSKSLSENVFQTLINEYSSSLIWWKKGVQAIYVNLAISKQLRNLFAQRTISLSKQYKDYLILGGNHRLRLFYGDLEDSIVILKNGEHQKFITNDIFIRTEYNLPYAPQIFDSGNDWLREEYFNGIPLNRLQNQEKVAKITREIIENHLRQLLIPSSEVICLKEYFELIENEVNEFFETKEITVKENVKSIIKKVFDLLFKRILYDSVKISWSHGDFQVANILINNDSFKVIDWEAANKRYYFYDLFTLASKIRSNISINEAINNFKSESLNFDNISLDDDMIFLLLIEELRFHINEEFSKNFYSSGIKTEKLCHSIITYINE